MHHRERARATPLAALGRGLIAGTAGTVAMTAYQELVARLKGSSDSGAGEQQDPWESAPAPAQVGRRLIEALFQTSLDARWAPVLTHTMHWLYGTLWGGVYALVEESRDEPGALAGPVFGLTVWAMSYVQLVPMGLYEPPWRYPAKTLALDVSYHLVYGSGVGAAHAVLVRRHPGHRHAA